MQLTHNEFYIQEYSKNIENLKIGLARWEKEAMAILSKGNVQGLADLYATMESDKADIKYFRKLKIHLIKLGGKK